MLPLFLNRMGLLDSSPNKNPVQKIYVELTLQYSRLRKVGRK